MSTEIENSNNYMGGHVFYFEPNDIDFGKDQNGDAVPLPAHMEDMCIAMTLIADIYPRDKSSIHEVNVDDKNNVKVQRRISWISHGGDNADLTSGGTQIGENRFLTTYYTEISADKYIENEFVEGLGVTGVNISFESWYTPTITINFVDVHGSSMWGREEAVHDNGEITAGNILGVFFTQPYPLFRLQVKGFLGKAVTYQLSVSDFKGRYNSQTGNFEITVTFIGYSYSLLTDIPLEPLSVVAECEYVGKKYWESHIDTEEWQLRNANTTTSQPLPLFVLIENIRSAVGALNALRNKDCQGIDLNLSSANSDGIVQNPVESGQNVSLSAANTVTNATAGNSELSKVYGSLKKFIDECDNFCRAQGGRLIVGNEGNGTYKKQMLFVLPAAVSEFSAVKKVTPTDNVRKAFKELSNNIDKYNQKNSQNKLDKPFTNEQARFLRPFMGDNSNYKDLTFEKLEKIKLFNLRQFSYAGRRPYIINKYPMYKETEDRLVDMYNTPMGVFYRIEPGWGCLVPLGTLYCEVENRMRTNAETGSSVQTVVENQYANQSNGTQVVNVESKNDRDTIIEETAKKRILEIIGIEPTIGNFVKLLMCHLETFVEVMFVCAENIYKDYEKRYPEQLGLKGLEGTDIPSANSSPRNVKDNVEKKHIYPWPALYDPEYDSNTETPSNADNKAGVLGWPLDYTPKDGIAWEESKVILSFMDAISRCKELVNTKYKNSVGNAYSGIPMTGADLVKMDSPFANVSSICKDIETLSPYLGLRIAQTIGVADDNCSVDIATAIGSIDALNLMQSSGKPTVLNGAIKSNDGKTSFSKRVIDYLTCNNKTSNTSSTENGESYNNFETTVGGTYYHKKRHPMFMLEKDKYKYTYTYGESIDGNGVVSIVPTELLPFNGNNPYAELLNPTVKDGSIVYIPNVDPNGEQKWIHTVDSKNLSVIAGNTFDTYKNNQMFSVIVDANAVNSFISQINALKDGSLKIKDYVVKGAKDDNNVKKFIERRYKIDDKTYSSFFFGKKNYHMMMPSIVTVDEKYSKEHLCYDKSQKDNVKFDNSWCYDTKSDLYKKTTLQQDGDNFSFKSGKEKYSATNVNVVDLPIKIGSVIGSLFGSKLYYQQNDIFNEEDNNKDCELRKLSKAYLILSSLMSGIDEPEKDLFKQDDKSIIKGFPPFYVLFIGALIWRKGLEEDVDINFKGYNAPDKDTSLISKNDKIMSIDANLEIKRYTLEDYYMKYDEIDVIVKNKLVELFKDYASNTIGKIVDAFELMTNDQQIINSQKWEEVSQQWCAFNDDDAKNPSKWTGIFGDFFDKYCSVVMSDSKGVLRLLMNDKNENVRGLDFLYGLEGRFIVGRATKKRIGKGDKEVKIPSKLFTAYLQGFESRIKDFKVEETKEEKKSPPISSTTIQRDTAVSMYYSFKHLWDTWLISASRHQFTIEEFFNKYFIFIDSFYVNTYDKIKLNAEAIKDAYETKDTNLFTFMNNVVSKAGVMTFALPDFIDTNIEKSTVAEYKNPGNKGEEFSWKRDDFKKMFTPLPYNEMNEIRANNVFVFIYTHPFSDTATENTDKRFDSYMMNNHNSWPTPLTKTVLPVKANAHNIVDGNDMNQIMLPNNSLSNETEKLITARYGYMMPCFGVTVNRGNNYIFKSINVNMDSPKITSVAAQTWENILTKTGADGSKRIFFHGQDIYSIYSQYAYGCEIEMMGCAQIQPLMYFQLLNIPMWRGTYMIYKVTHTLSPGQMITKFTGMKMSRYQAPFATGYFTVGKESSQNRITINGNMGASNGGSFEGQGNVGGEGMVKAIFGTYRKYKLSHNYDQARGWATSQKTGKKYYHWHCGEDIFGEPGTPLYAPWDGVVIYAKTSNGSAGNHLKFKDASGTVAISFMHCQSLNVQTGETVKAGSVLAYLGYTGGNAATGASCTASSAHLHLELYINGKFTEGESYRHQGENGCTGNGQHVDPLKTYGSVAVSSTQVASTSTGSSKSTSKNTGDNSLHTNAKIILHKWGVAGDSWSCGLKDYFRYHCGVVAHSLKDTLNDYVPKLIGTDCDKIIISCGLNDGYKSVAELKKLYIQIGQAVFRGGKRCYIHTFPPLKKTSLDSYVSRLNQAIMNGATEGHYTPIDVGNFTNNGTRYFSPKGDGFHLDGNGLKELYNIIERGVINAR